MTTHVFIVDAQTFQFHLQYMFVGTGAGTKTIDFNNSTSTSLNYAVENGLVGMIADFSRVRVGDFVIFYLQQNKGAGIGEGKFYGVFKVKGTVFLDKNSQYLNNQLGKHLIFRGLIEPKDVYSEGVTEWEALDEIKHISSAYQMLWSLIYRKLKGNRGNTMITLYESERLIKLIRDKNKRLPLSGHNFCFDIASQKIITTNNNCSYQGVQETIVILPRLCQKAQQRKQFEAHLQAYLLQHFEHTIVSNFFSGCDLEWLGNEVSCGVGMQSIDIMASLTDEDGNHIILPIELKSCEVYVEIVTQVQRYINWIEQYYIPNRISDIQPVIICNKTDKLSQRYTDFTDKVNVFNIKNNTLPLAYIEFEINNGVIHFTRIF